ncbi:MAG: TIGR00282 family metallophosphoesterase [Ruminococcus sp.]|nr:TIGR00282 family metallophosphoesterase [Ruminococcus sp.]
MKILCIGDVVGKIGCEYLRSKLPNLKKFYGIDMVICNGENSADGNGITPVSAKFLFDSGVDVITLGNHSFRRREVYDYLDNTPYIIRPANFPSGSTPGVGMCVFDMGRISVTVINLMGTMFLESSLPSPFDIIDGILEKIESKITVIDFHAETTSEKLAMGYYLDGRVSAIFGTHTHVQTSDDRVLSGGTGYITDVGMTGPMNSVLGVKPDIVIEKFKTRMPVRFDIKQDECKLEAVIFDIDERTAKTKSAERLRII